MRVVELAGLARGLGAAVSRSPIFGTAISPCVKDTPSMLLAPIFITGRAGQVAAPVGGGCSGIPSSPSPIHN